MHENTNSVKSINIGRTRPAKAFLEYFYGLCSQVHLYMFSQVAVFNCQVVSGILEHVESTLQRSRQVSNSAHLVPRTRVSPPDVVDRGVQERGPVTVFGNVVVVTCSTITGWMVSHF